MVDREDGSIVLDSKIFGGILTLSVEGWDGEEDSLEDSEGWLSESIFAEWESRRIGDRNDASVDSIPVGCYADGTDNDHQMWSKAHEGARILESIIADKAQPLSEFPAGNALWMFPEECEEIGSAVVELLTTLHIKAIDE